MTVFGDRNSFALEVAPLASPPQEADPSSAATWTALQLHVEGRNLCEHVIRSRDLVGDAVHWPAIGLARWFVSSWDALFHTGPWIVPGLLRTAREVAHELDNELVYDLDAPDDRVDVRDDFVEQHSLRAAATGAALPDVWISRDGDVVSVAWNNSTEGDLGFFLSRGEADIPTAVFAEAVRGFVTWVHGLLEDASDHEAVRRDRELLHAWIENFDSPDAALSGLLHEIGLGSERWERLRKTERNGEDISSFFRIDPSWTQAGTSVDVRASSVAMAFRCATPALDDAGLLAIRDAINDTSPVPSAMQRLDQLARAVPAVDHRARDYTQGYQLARAVRESLANSDGSLDIDFLMGDLGIPVHDLALADVNIDGGCVCDRDHGPVVFVNPGSPRAATVWGRRVVLAHELCHLLFDRSAAVALGMLSGPWAPPRIERRANAFAVELLLPLLGIERHIGDRWRRPVDADLQLLKDAFNVGTTVATEHLRNLLDPRNR